MYTWPDLSLFDLASVYNTIVIVLSSKLFLVLHLESDWLPDLPSIYLTSVPDLASICMTLFVFA